MLVHPYLLPEDDGLPMRESQDYAKDKLRVLEGYIARFTTSMRKSQWSALGYIDLLAGPGKNRFQPSGDILLGSPLIALTAKYPFTYYRFVEMGNQEYVALARRITSSEHAERVKVIHGDCNAVVNTVVADIASRDKRFLAEHKWSSLNLAFLDPEGLELEWATVEKLGRIRRMDIILNFSTSGFTRNAAQMLMSENTARLDRFFGTTEWKMVYQEVSKKDNSYVRRAMLDFYKSRLVTLGYKIHPDERVFKTSKGVQVYTLMFASKHDLGNKFWSGAIQEVSQPKLF